MPPPKGDSEGLFSRMARFVRAPSSEREGGGLGGSVAQSDSVGAGSASRPPAPGSGPTQAADLHGAAVPAGFPEPTPSGVEVAESSGDPELEDAAIRFASGDDAGAQAALLALLAPGGPRAGHTETWLALFDLLRATGQQASYDGHALAFADRFARSAPQWHSLARAGSLAADLHRAAPAGPRLDWISPGVLDGADVDALRAVLARTALPWRLSWHGLARIERGAVDALCQLMGHWTAQPVQLAFVGAERLAQVLAATTVAGERGSDPAWWMLRMQALRVMQRADEFEQVALDYCVTYEVSPPSWDQPRCQFSALLGPNAAGERPEALSPAEPAASAQAPAELAGTLQGDATETLRRIEALQPQASSLVISCAQLVRIDFTAAGTLLNWTIARQAEGRKVHLTDVHRLVASFLDVIGVSAQARVSVRRD